MMWMCWMMWSACTWRAPVAPAVVDTGEAVSMSDTGEEAARQVGAPNAARR